MLILLSDAVADAFGADDTSARRDNDALVGLMTIILLGIVEDKSIDWNSWFCLAGSVLLGCPFRGDCPDWLAVSAGPICALQYGSLAAVAGWLDMNKELKVHGSFSLNYGEGKLGTISGDYKDNEFRGIVSDFAIVQTEETQRTTSYNESHPKEPDRNWSETCDLTDQSKAESDCILISLPRERYDGYRLLTRVKSNTHSRIVHPTMAIVNIAADIPSLPSAHDCTEHAGHGQSLSLPKTMTLYSFDEVLGRWPEAGKPDLSNCSMSAFLDTDLKVNVAYSLLTKVPSLDDQQKGRIIAISTSKEPCVECMKGYFKKHSARKNKSMYIINTASHTPHRHLAIMATGLGDCSGVNHS